ncbi:MAG: cyclic nucleotide-binding domain-containing protein, partial [Methylomarinum sp.]|nr:cyclic nucleotide-binding domain-containing protein [Methylomarinum sp.]
CVLRKINKKEFDEIILAKQQGLYDELNEQGNLLLQKDSIVFSSFLSDHVNNQIKEEKIAPETAVFKEGSEGKRFYLILDGRAKVSRNGTHIATLVEGNYFGDAAILKKQPHQVTIEAEDNLTVVSIDAIDFRRLYEDKESTTVREYIDSMNGFNRNAHGVIYSPHQSHYKNKKSLTTILTYQNGEACSITKVFGKSHSAKYAKQVDIVDENGKSLGKQDIELRQQDLLETSATSPQLPLLYLQNNRLVAAEINAEYANLDHIVPAIIERKIIWPWQQALYRSKGDLWIHSAHDDPRDAAVICSCMGTTRRELKQKVAFGCVTAEQLANETGASLACGFCRDSVTEIATSSAKMMAAKVVGPLGEVSYCNKNKDVKCFRLRPENGCVEDYLPGQHIKLEGKINGQWIQRAYTLTSNANQNEYYEIAVKREPCGVFSKWLHDELDENSEILISKPQGHYHLIPSTKNPIICFVGGVGVTPAIAFLRYLTTIKHKHALYIDYSVSTKDDISFEKEFKQIAEDNFKVNLRVTERRSNRNDLYTGRERRESIGKNRISEKDVESIVTQYPDADFYICGSKPYDEAIKYYLNHCGVKEEKVHSEQFDSSQKRPQALMLASCTTLIFALLFFIMPPYLVPSSVHSIDLVELIPSDYTGYGILGLGLVGLLIALPRRYGWVRKLDTSIWRLMHVWLGVFALILLFLHTGFSMGGDVHTTFLTVCFLTLSILGAVTGMTIALQGKISPAQTYIYKKNFKWLHILVSWPLPILLLTHILSTYTNIWF